MAGRYVLLQFDDKDAAEAFVENDHLPSQLGFKVEAMFLQPTKFCTCPDKARHDVRNWVKNRKFGLYVCKVCRKPSSHHESGILSRLQYVFGFNIMGDK